MRVGAKRKNINEAIDQLPWYLKIAFKTGRYIDATMNLLLYAIWIISLLFSSYNVFIVWNMEKAVVGAIFSLIVFYMGNLSIIQNLKR